ncbi:hypothetical protein STENM223S_01242 [Streptomyces tendae]
MATSAPVPIARAASSLPCSSAFRCRAVRRIQKTIHVTRTTATIDSEPPRASCALNVSSCEPNSSAQPKPNARAIATPMPAQMGFRASRRPVLTR